MNDEKLGNKHPRVDAIDLSHWQVVDDDRQEVIDEWSNLFLVMHKFSQGVSYEDPTAPPREALADKIPTSTVWNGYHLYEWEKDAGYQGVSERTHAIDVAAELMEPGDIFTLDLENSEIEGAIKAVTAEVAAYRLFNTLKEAQRRLRCIPWIYASWRGLRRFGPKLLTPLLQRFPDLG